MSDLFFYTTAGALVLGIAVGSLVTFTWPVLVWIISLALLCALGATRSREASTGRVLLLLSVVIFSVAIGLVRVIVEPPVTTTKLDDLVEQSFELEGMVVREPDVRERTTHLYIDVDDTLVLAYADRYVDVQYGDRVLLAGQLKKPEAFETDLGRTFNYPGYLRARGVGYVMSFADVSVVESAVGNTWLIQLYAAKQDFMQRLERILPEPQVGLSEGLLLGVKQALGAEYETIFRRTGLMHIVVLSGYNVMLVVTFFMYVLSYLLPYRWRLLVGVVAIAGFALLVGFSATVVRASVMASLLLLLRFNNNNYHVLRALCLAGLVMLFLNPYLLLFDVGFQLSFMATLGLILLVEPVSQRLVFVPTFFGMREFLTATLVTQFFVLPLLAYQIGELSIVSVLANVLVLPMVPVAMLLTFLAGVVSYVWPFLGTLVGYVAYGTLSYILDMAALMASIPGATVKIPAFSVWWLLPTYIVVAIITYIVVRKPAAKSKITTVATLIDWEIVDEADLEKI